jgi:hypothetical protein
MILPDALTKKVRDLLRQNPEWRWDRAVKETASTRSRKRKPS